ncbi:MAG: hypothetical protein D4R74_02990 [Betaproteobacteria bacterium]|nr:MAG: hypothetical protein D4R74_02990 [Betaproteobacteria bacterium]
MNLAGGIAQKIARRTGAGGLMTAFNARRTQAEPTRRVPVQGLMTGRQGLLGAALIALQR